MTGWWIANVVGIAVVVPLVIVLANRVIRQALEAARYADDILEHGAMVAANLEPAAALAETAERGVEVRTAATRYVAALDGRG